jgi:parallel beta-helix repeat protein
VVSASIGDSDTPPTNGFNSGFTTAVAEQTYEHDGVNPRDWVGAMGGNIATVDDTDTPPGGGPGDTNVAVTVSGADVTGVDFGFAYNVVVNSLDSRVDPDQGSLRQTLSNADAIAGANTVVFTILGPPYTIALAPLPPPSLLLLPAITDPVVIDGTTQPGYSGSPIIMVDGGGGSSPIFTIEAGNSTVQGLALGNATYGIQLGLNGNNTIRDNYIGTDVSGLNPHGGSTHAISIVSASNNNVIEGNVIADYAAGIDIRSNSNGTVIQGNYIGTNMSDDPGLGNSYGVFNYEVSNTTITGNVIARNTDNGVHISSSSSNTVQGNQIYRNGVNGMLVTGLATSSNNTIEGNTIYRNGSNGIQLAGDTILNNTVQNNTIYNNSANGIVVNAITLAEQNTIQQNSIYNNTGLGIDLNNDGVTLNDPNDADTGPNTLLNFPVIDSAVISGPDVTVTGFARPGSIIEFFVADAGGASTFGEGRTYLVTRIEGSGDDGNDGTGSYGPGPPGEDDTNRFSFTFPAGALTVGDWLTATATDGVGNTSEFGLNIQVN